MNTQVSPNTGFSASELFLGRPSWKFEVIPEVENIPTLDSCLEEQMYIQEKASKRLLELRSKAVRYANKGRVTPMYTVGKYVLIHHARWPQKKLKKIECPWYGPFHIF